MGPSALGPSDLAAVVFTDNRHSQDYLLTVDAGTAAAPVRRHVRFQIR